ncbi:Methyltransferase domain-containing protein [Mycolicibacterium rutilum]|uniref:Methyltransferase domain-containing protein n=1 Tax=Mycolicibacterium rutilum TaxID=370526 RepID=A0A1H6KMV5_MYCRU|nr:class I SAM-dependent methyltransferase [Mycolicibacterium rutilum]SEH72877.1 Methyltransferase domain-containing protein [Mycolicibacterium rutilum]
MTREYWNHNTAYHPWLVDIAARHRGDVLDVGCGDGLLAQRLAPVSRSVTAIDPDREAIHRAGIRLSDDDVTLAHTTFDRYDPAGRRFDLITFVASLHHMDLHASLAKARSMLRPSGEIAVVGLSANRSVTDYLWALLCLPVVRLGSWWHGETPDIGVRVADPDHSLDEIRRGADAVLPGATIRRALYYRYLLRWSPRSIHSSS